MAFVAIAIALLATACSTSSPVEFAEGGQPVGEPTAPAATTTPIVESTASQEPEATPTEVAVVGDAAGDEATPTALPTPQPEGPCGAGPLAVPNPDRPRYAGNVSIDPEAGTVTGQLDIAFTPDLDIDELYLRLWPNGPRPASGGVAMSLGTTQFPGRPIDPVMPEMVTPTTALIPLAEPVAAGESIEITTTFALSVPNELKSRLSGRDDYMRLGTILPLLPWEPGRGWALDPATSLFAEAVSSPVAWYDITIDVPDGYDVLASGVDLGGGRWHVEVARDFAISVGRFRMITGVAMAPEPVQVTVGVHETLGDDEGAYLAKVIDSLEQFSRRWGQYPWPSLTFALTPNLGGGIEFPTHIMQGPGTIGRTTSHEVGHMFFYSLVGNNQGTEPWLDEGITSYAEFSYEGVGAGAYAIPSDGVGNATQPMTFWEGRSDIYYRSVYGQTGFALLQLGPREEVDCALAHYVAANAHQIATAQDFIDAFEPTFPDVVEQLAALGVDLDG